MQQNPFSLPLFLCALANLLVIGAIWRRRQTPAARALMVLQAAIAVWCAGSSLSLAASAPDSKLFWARIEFGALLIAAVFWVIFALQYTGYWGLARRWSWALFILPVAAAAAVWSSTFFDYVFTGMAILPHAGYSQLQLNPGPIYWIVIGQSYACGLVGAAVFFNSLRAGSHAQRVQLTPILAALGLVALANVVSVFRLLPGIQVDLTPFAFSITALVIAWSFYWRELLVVIPVARAAVFDHMTDGVLIIDRRHVLTDMNTHAQRMFGLARTVLGRPVTEIFENGNHAMLPLTRLSHGRSVVTINERSLDVAVSPVINGDDVREGTLIVVRDISGWKSAEQEQQRQRQLFANLAEVALMVGGNLDLQSILETTVDIVLRLTDAEDGSLFLFDQGDRVQRTLSTAAARRPGTSSRVKLAETVMTQGLAGWVAKHRRPVLVADTRLDNRWITLPDQPYSALSALVVPILFKGRLIGILTVLHSAADFFNRDHQRFLEAAVTQIGMALHNALLYEEQRVLVAALSAAKAEAEAANRAKSIFLANMSHELRTPLTAILGYTELIDEILDESDRPEGGIVSDGLRHIAESGEHLLAVINDILDLSKIEAGRIDITSKRVNVAALLKMVAVIGEGLMSTNGNQFVLEMPEDIGVIYTDPTRLRQVLLNLLSNAAKFTENGVVTVRAFRNETQSEIRFEVQDTGIGIPADKLEAIFQPFVQVDDSVGRRFGGTGLGLAISRRFVDLLGGTLTAASEPGAGSLFILRLPSGTGDEEQGSDPPAFAHADGVEAVRPAAAVTAPDAYSGGGPIRS